MATRTQPDLTKAAERLRAEAWAELGRGAWGQEDAFLDWLEERRRNSRVEVAWPPGPDDLGDYIRRAGPVAFRSPSFLTFVLHQWDLGRLDISFSRSNPGAIQRRRARAHGDAKALRTWFDRCVPLIARADRITAGMEDVDGIRACLLHAGIGFTEPDADLAVLLAAYRARRRKGSDLPHGRLAADLWLRMRGNLPHLAGPQEAAAEAKEQAMRNALKRPPRLGRKPRE